MRYFPYVFLIALLLNGCTSLEMEPPVTNHTDDLKLLQRPVLLVEPLPVKATAKTVQVDGVDYAGFDRDGIDRLRLSRKIAQKNIEILREVIAANEDTIAAHNAVVLMSQALEQRSNAMAVELVRTERKLREEEKARALEKFGYQLLLLLGFAAGAL